MTYYVIIALCIIILASYFFDVTARYTRIPGVIVLIIMGMVMNYGQQFMKFKIPDLSGLLPAMGTLGLILIVLEGSLDLTLRSTKREVIYASFSSAVLLFILFAILASYAISVIYGHTFRVSLLNIIPLAIISSAVAIPAAENLAKADKDFVVYESSLSDIVGILAFNFILYQSTELGKGFIGLVMNLIITFLVSVVFSTGLAVLLHKITHHVKYVIITTGIIAAYSLAMLEHMPSLLMVLIFGLVMNNIHLFKGRFTMKYIDFENFSSDLTSFKQITREMTFLIRSFFFIMFGFYTNLTDVLNLNSLYFALLISASGLVLRGLFLRFVLRKPLIPLLFFMPRGLITILLFLGLPAGQMLPFMNKGLITQVIFISILMLSLGTMILKKEKQEAILTS